MDCAKGERFLSWMRTKRPCGFTEFESLLNNFITSWQFTELHLDSLKKCGGDCSIPLELFTLQQVTWLSLSHNNLERIPPDIGRMGSLEHLVLTGNKLDVASLPRTLTFCRKLKTLLLDNNLLDALPGFLLSMPSLATVHRHGNHNYFKSTFMWYHTDVNERILKVTRNYIPKSYSAHSLQFLAAQALISSPIDYLTDKNIPPSLKVFLAESFRRFNICENCKRAFLKQSDGYKVITFKNPYLGNTCVPFEHWACSLECSKAIEIPARKEQVEASKKADREYEKKVKFHERDIGLRSSIKPSRKRPSFVKSCTTM